MKKAIVILHYMSHTVYLHPNATIEDLINKFCEQTGLKNDNPILQFLTIDGSIPSKHTKLFEMYFGEDFLIRIPNRVEYGDIVEEDPPVEIPYMVYVVLNYALYLIFLPKCAKIADLKKHIVNVTGIRPEHPSLKSLKIDGNQFEDTCSLSDINFDNPNIIYLEDFNYQDLPEEVHYRQYKFFVVWNNKLVIVNVDKISSMGVLIGKIIEETGIPQDHPGLKNISIEGNTRDYDDTVLASFNLSKNSAILLRNIKVSRSEVKMISLLIHFNLKLYVIIICNTNTIEKLITEVSKATSLSNGHPLLQNMVINGNLLRNFIFVSDLQLSMETHVYLDKTPVYFTSNHPLTSEPYIYLTIIFDKKYDIIVPSYISIGLLKQAIVCFIGLGTDSKCLETLNIEGYLATNDYLILSEFTSNKIVTLYMYDTTKSTKLKPFIEFTIFYNRKSFNIIIERDKTIQNLIYEMHRISEMSLLAPECNSLVVNGIVKYGDELLSTIPHDYATISLDTDTMETNLQIPVGIKKFCIIYKKQKHITSIAEDQPLRYLLHYMVRIISVPPNHSFFKNLIIEGKLASVNSIISELNLNNYTIIDIDAVENVMEEKYAIAFSTKKKYHMYRKIEAIVETYQIKHLHNLDPKKKLLVLDLDLTLIDFPLDGILHNNVLRPHLHTFLTVMYKYYNLIVWSATDCSFILNKLKVLSLDNHEGFKFTALVDDKAMIPVNLTFTKQIRVKPLKVIWNIFHEFHKKNTIMLDDISTNFLLNPLNGIVVKPYAVQNYKTDNELEKLQNYLKNVALISEDFTQIKLESWETSDLR